LRSSAPALAGKSVVVLEQDQESVGGISRTVEQQAFLFDIGGHRFFSKARRAFPRFIPSAATACTSTTTRTTR